MFSPQSNVTLYNRNRLFSPIRHAKRSTDQCDKAEIWGLPDTIGKKGHLSSHIKNCGETDVRCSLNVGMLNTIFAHLIFDCKTMIASKCFFFAI